MWPITLRSHRYEDFTVTYIRRVKIPSHKYAKHQYKQESEYESTVVIYILIKILQVHCYPGCDPILHEYYITRWCKSKIYKVIYKIQKPEKYSRAAKRNLKSRSRGDRKKRLWLIRLLHKRGLIFHQRVHYAFAECSGIWTSRSRDCQKATQQVRKMKSGDMHNKHTCTGS